MILQILARCGAFFIGFIVKGQMNHDFAFGIEVNPCVIEITIGKTHSKQVQQSGRAFARGMAVLKKHKFIANLSELSPPEKRALP